MTPFEALYRKLCHSLSCWLDNRDLVLVGPKISEKTIKIVDLIKKRMKEARDHHNSYSNLHKKPFEFKVRDPAFLKILLVIRRVMSFDKSSKLNIRYVGHLRFLEEWVK